MPSPPNKSLDFGGFDWFVCCLNIVGELVAKSPYDH